MELRHEAALKQQAALSPRLYQSMKILRMGAPELLELLQQQLEENPALEIPEPSDYDPAADSGERQLWEEYTRANSRAAKTSVTTDRGDSAAEMAASPVTLGDHLTLQLDLEGLSEREHRIGLMLIGSLNDDGYLADSLECIARGTGIPVEEIEAVLQRLQRFDPPGIGARNLEECLLIQLRLLRGGRLARKIVARCLPEVARNAIQEIARAVDAPAAEVERAIALIRELNPAPGSLFDTGPPAAAVIPDVYVRKAESGFQIIANRETVPPLKLNQTYRELARAAGTGEETATYIKQKISEASQLIRDFRQRRATIVRVTRAIAEEQEPFFARGPAHLSPLTVDDIARKLEVHPSTISRAILGKYMNTPFGVFEFRYFFSAGYSTGGGKSLAANAVKKRISEIIARENPLKPLSDQKIADLLAGESIDISRRTVAKYREDLGALPSWQRKKIGSCRQGGSAPEASTES